MEYIIEHGPLTEFGLVVFAIGIILYLCLKTVRYLSSPTIDPNFKRIQPPPIDWDRVD